MSIKTHVITPLMINFSLCRSYEEKQIYRVYFKSFMICCQFYKLDRIGSDCGVNWNLNQVPPTFTQKSIHVNFFLTNFLCINISQINDQTIFRYIYMHVRFWILEAFSTTDRVRKATHIKYLALKNMYSDNPIFSSPFSGYRHKNW